MKRIILIIAWCVFVLGLKAQPPLQLDCNTVFVCLDSITYSALFSNPFVKDTLAICRENTTSTGSERYSGKYFIGKSATLEFFQPTLNNQVGDHLGDVGIEFKTRLLGDRRRVVKNAKQLKVLLDTSTVYLQTEEGKISWYSVAKVMGTTQNLELSIIDYTAAFLNFRSFTKAEISRPMTYGYYNTRLSGGRSYPRLFNEITELVLEVDSLNLNRLRGYAKLNLLKEVGQSFEGAAIKIIYKLVKEGSGARLVSMKLGLLVDQSDRKIQLSDRLWLHVYGRTAELSFFK